jgi:NAD(P)-dependent dehydrogenase (short-subunit alcohol dehydrogenase family)
MTVTLVTGAPRGLGLETARQLGELGQTVVIGARDPERGRTGQVPCAGSARSRQSREASARRRIAVSSASSVVVIASRT